MLPHSFRGIGIHSGLGSYAEGSTREPWRSPSGSTKNQDCLLSEPGLFLYFDFGGSMCIFLDSASVISSDAYTPRMGACEAAAPNLKLRSPSTENK